MTPAGYFAQLALNGQCFIGTSAVAGVVPPVTTATAQTFALWNPAGSGVNVVLNQIMLGDTIPGSVVATAFALSYLPNAGSSIGTPISAFTAVSPVNALINGGNASRIRFAPGAATTTAATHLMSLGISRESTTVGNGLWNMTHNFNGELIVPPNNLIALSATIASVNALFVSLTWAEVPIS